MQASLRGWGLRLAWLVALCGWLMADAMAVEPGTVPEAGFTHPPPLEPQQALESFQIQQGFRLELVAAEPLLVDPVDVAYDEHGRAYVVEMRGYPLPEKADDARPQPISRVRLLFDDDLDGQFDRSTVFVDQLDWPTSVCLWQGGVFIADAPDLWYAKDTNGDGVADIRERVLTGFKRDNVQALVNNLRWGLDHRIYGAASGNGGQLTVPARPEVPAVSVTRRDFRYDPVQQSVEAISGGARFGQSFDDFGNRFLCNIRNPVQHVVLPLEPLMRNPWLALPSLLHDVADAGETLPVFRISPVESWREFRARRWVQERSNYPRSELVGAGYFTSSSGVTLYRGDQYPDEFNGQAFVADVAANIIHRQRLTPQGLTFLGTRADAQAEFVASTDIWFRPVNFANAPDGTLHVVDMYRLNIEHPWSIPDDIRAKLDLTLGNDRGRLWRLAPPGYQRPAIRSLAKASTAELVSLLASRNSWLRETAHRLIYERQDRAAASGLRQLLQEDTAPLGQIHALWSLAGLDAIAWEDVSRGLQVANPRVREQALIIAASHYQQEPDFAERLRSLARDDDMRVRLQAVFALGDLEHADVVPLIADIAERDAADPWMRTAVLSTPLSRSPDLLEELLARGAKSNREGLSSLVHELARMVGTGRGDVVLDDLLGAAELPAELQFSVWSGWMNGVQQRRDRTVTTTLAKLREGAAWNSLQAEALAAASDDGQSATVRVQAIALLRQGSWETLSERAPAFFSPRQPRDVQQAALRAIVQTATSAAADLLVDQYRQMAPALRSEAVDALAARPAWHRRLLTALDDKAIAASDVSPARRALLLRQTDPEVKSLAERWFGSTATSSRQTVLAEYQPSLQRSPHAAKGRAVFRRECAQCHRLQDEGFDVGPPLASIRNRSPEELLIHILDPNREIGPNYIDYAVTLADGRVLTGLITQESDTQLTLLRPQGVRDDVLKRDVDDVASTGKSLMPEGLEQRISQQEMADLIEYLLRPDVAPAAP